MGKNVTGDISDYPDRAYHSNMLLVLESSPFDYGYKTNTNY